MIIGYARISKGEDQSLKLQHQALKTEKVDKIFDEVASGGRWDRPQLHKRRSLMTKTILIRLFLLLSLVKTISHSYASSMSFDEVREIGGFRSQSLTNVTHIYPSGNKLTFEEKSDLLTSKYLKKIHTLSLFNQDLDDDFISNLSERSTLVRLINLDLSKNESITVESLNSILESNILGLVRDLPQISGRYGIPSSTIYVTAKKTSVKLEEKNKHQTTIHRLGFSIHYRHPLTDEPTDTSVDFAVKFVECSF